MSPFCVAPLRNIFLIAVSVVSPDSGSDQKICQRKAFNNEAEPGELLKYKHTETGLVVAALRKAMM